MPVLGDSAGPGGSWGHSRLKKARANLSCSLREQKSKQAMRFWEIPGALGAWSNGAPRSPRLVLGAEGICDNKEGKFWAVPSPGQCLQSSQPQVPARTQLQTLELVLPQTHLPLCPWNNSWSSSNSTSKLSSLSGFSHSHTR